MTISTLLMILALAVAPGTSEPTEGSYTSTCPVGRVCKIGSNCWINGVWYNPCPEDAPPDPAPDPTPDIILMY